MGHRFLLVFVHTKDAPSVLDYPASSPANEMIPGCELIGLAGIGDRHGLESVIGMAGIGDRHGPESVIGMRRNR